MTPSKHTITPDDLRGGIHKRMEHLATVVGNQPALHFDDTIVSYGQLEADANRLAGQIQAESDSPFVATQLSNDVMTVIAAFAIFKLGRTWVPINSNVPTGATASYLQKYADPLLLTSMDTEIPHERSLPVSAGMLPALPDAPPISATVDGDDICLMLSTSGSTGTPKAIPWPHDKLANNLATRISFAQSDPQLMSFWGMIYAANLMTLFATLCHGGTFHRKELQRFPLHDLHRRIKQAGIHIVACVPSSFRVLFARVSPGDFPALTEIRLGGETMLATDLDLFKQNFARSVSITNSMGSTEAGSIGIFPATHDTVVTTASVPVGKIGGEREVYVVNTDGERIVAEEGEIRVSAPDLTPYWNDPQESAKKFFPDPARPGWTIFHTGDLGMMLEDGNLVHLGRMDLQVKIRGQRVEIAAIENRLLQHPAIEIAVVNPVGADENLQLAAYYTLDPQVEPPDAAALRVFLAEVLPDYMLPSYLVPMQQLPTLPTGKVNRQALPAPDRSLMQPSRPITPPKTRTERQLLAIWQDVLDTPFDISTDDSFFELGGSSLQATALISDVNELFDVILTPATLYQHSSIAELARFIEMDDETAGMHPAILPFRPYGTRLPIFCFPGSLGNGLAFRNLALLLGHEFPVYGLQVKGLDGKLPLPDTLDELVDYYTEAILSLGFRTRVYLLGLSSGGIHAFEVARRLRNSEVQVEAIIMLDTPFVDDALHPIIHPDVVADAAKIAAMHEERKDRLKNIRQLRHARRKDQTLRKRRRRRRWSEVPRRWVNRLQTLQVILLLNRVMEPALPERYVQRLRIWEKNRADRKQFWREQSEEQVRQPSRPEAENPAAFNERLIETSIKILQNYRAEALDVDLVFIKALQDALDNREERWQEVVTGSHEIIRLDVAHTMTNQPHVVKVVDALKQYALLK